MYKHLQMLNGPEYIATAEALGLDYNNGGYNTNFHDVITRTGLIHQHHLAFSGVRKTQTIEHRSVLWIIIQLSKLTITEI